MLDSLQPVPTGPSLPELFFPLSQRPSMDIFPVETVRRRVAAWHGMSAEVVRFTRSEKVVVEYTGAYHLVVAHRHGTRQSGETRVDGVAASTLKDMRRKISVVPAGHRYSESLDPKVLPEITYFYIEPTSFAGLTDQRAWEGLRPRLFFEDALLWDTIAKLNAAIETFTRDDDDYLQALGRVLVHELARMETRDRPSRSPMRGGLAAWQERVIVEHIEKHLSETLELSGLAELVRLSPQHFCRAFKQSLGMPPCRYHASRRIERAKLLLAQANVAITEIGLALGYSETSSFTAAFRRGTGLTPTAYRRSLV